MPHSQPFLFNLSTKISFYHNTSFDLKTAYLKNTASYLKSELKILQGILVIFLSVVAKDLKKSNSRKEGCTLGPVTHSVEGVTMGHEAAGHILSTVQKQREMLSYSFIFI